MAEKEFYTQNNWKGSRFTRDLSLKDIAKDVRTFLKANYPGWKFSVRTEYASLMQELSVAVIETAEPLFDKTKMRAIAEQNFLRKSYWGETKTAEGLYNEYCQKAFEEGYLQSWDYYNENDSWFTESVQKKLNDIVAYVESFNRRDCDAMIDYFDVHFYTRYSIGKWDKPVKVNQA